MTILLQHRPAPAVAQGSPLVIFQLDGGKGPSRHTLKRLHGSLWVGVQGNRRRFALRHRHFNLAKQRYDLLRAEPLLRHDQLLSKLFSHIAWSKKPGQVIHRGTPRDAWSCSDSRHSLVMTELHAAN
jgi:hypothetical protein